MKTVLIIGAGPAGLTAAYELLSKSNEYEVIVFEESNNLGGISRTINYKGNRMDMGGHRFFSKVPEVNKWWEAMLPTQGTMPFDDVMLGRVSKTMKGGPNPEKTDKVMLQRNRLSRIFFNKKFFDYPISLKFETIQNMGVKNTISIVFSYLKSVFHKREEKSLEDFYINRFGKKLYSMFFENYTEKLWGKHPSKISPEWGVQRVKGLSLRTIIEDILAKKNDNMETSLIKNFSYPKLGPGQLWEITATEIKNKGGKIIKNAKVIEIIKNGNTITKIKYKKGNKIITKNGDIIISSMPIKNLIEGMNNVPQKIVDIASGLPYRNFITIGVLTKSIQFKNKTKIKTIGNIIPDNWVYVQDKSVKMGRFQIYNNWSPYMVKDIKNTIWIGLEYFCNENDVMWSMTDNTFTQMSINEMLKIGLISNISDVLDSHVERVEKAYPAYFGTYDHMKDLKQYLDTIDNLFCVGRNGQHRYNNIDHSMCTSFEAVKNILSGTTDKNNIWNINTESEYCEEK